jgi:hypothetical protein
MLIKPLISATPAKACEHAAMASFSAEDGAGRAAGRATLIMDIVHCFRSREFHGSFWMESTGPAAQTTLLLKQLAQYHEAHADMVNFSPQLQKTHATPAEPAKSADPLRLRKSPMPLIQQVKS